jgi:hypothetical protein
MGLRLVAEKLFVLWLIIFFPLGQASVAPWTAKKGSKEEGSPCIRLVCLRKRFSNSHSKLLKLSNQQHLHHAEVLARTVSTEGEYLNS